ncbi:cation/H(+) symporter 13-like [Citrus sinensis]|uniref:cation/H(+) symporter 13-like n=1 Tax=Citrus sinensis TaxID=2711 RepID=UPI00227877C0|nr:cation/H(+) symporter 13-like [Citrus sinensis]
MAQILGGAIIGPSILGDDTSTLFPMRNRHILRTFAEFGMILHIFVLGVQIDLGLIKHIRRRAVAIGFFGCLIPLIFGMSSFRLIQQQKSRFDVESATGIAASVAANSMTSLVVVTSVLKELNMLNSELGRLASSAAMWDKMGNVSIKRELDKKDGVDHGDVLYRGIPEIALYCMWKDKKTITSQIFALLIANMVIVTSIASAVVGYLYDPSRRYKLDVRRAISKTKQNNLRILVCINKEDNMNPIISLLEASNPTRNFPITAFVLQLIELKGSVTAFLKPYHQHTQSVVASSTHLINAFAQLERSYHGNIVVQHFTTIAPYASMHDDVCTLALDKRAAIIIVPFHKQWGVNCLVESSELPIRALNGNILDKAPCSVGVLVQRGKIKSIRPTFDFQLSYHIVMLFVGGADDREALAYSRLMVEHPNISLTVVWFVSSDPDTSSGIETTDDRDLDNHAFDEFKDSVVTKKITLRVEIVKDGIGTTRVIQTLTENFDLFIVGKNHDPCSKVTLGLSEWIEYPELGIIGDTLVNSSEEFSVLVVQQQPQEIRHKSKAFTKS